MFSWIYSCITWLSFLAFCVQSSFTCEIASVSRSLLRNSQSTIQGSYEKPLSLSLSSWGWFPRKESGNSAERLQETVRKQSLSFDSVLVITCLSCILLLSTSSSSTHLEQCGHNSTVFLKTVTVDVFASYEKPRNLIFLPSHLIAGRRALIFMLASDVQRTQEGSWDESLARESTTYKK